MADEHRVQQVIERAEGLVDDLDKTVSDLIQLLREYQENQEEVPNA